MRVKLSYTVEEEDVLKEGQKIISLCGDHMQEALQLFTDVQKELNPQDPDAVCNTPLVIEMVDKFRKVLLAVDTRFLEVGEIVRGYQQFQTQETPGDAPDSENE
tara:strand:+ start:160 stop:471 length:312 start_codon:yes stop_codon:yes gene_type:complete